MVIPFYLAHGATLKEALDWNVSGCCENRLINRETHVTGNGGINYGSVVEMTLRNGKLKVFKDLQFGVATGDPRSWKSFSDVWKAFCEQLENLARHAVIQQHVALRIKPNYFAAPATSMLHDLAMAECRDLHSHGDYIPGAIDHSCFEAIGKATAIDSLAAVRHLIFDTGKLTWDQLLTAMENNWEGHEAVRQMCLSAPKYGNGIEWVDAIGFEIERFLLEFLHKYPKPHNQAFLLRQIPVTFHVPMGRVTWATPNGRRAHEYLTDCHVPRIAKWPQRWWARLDAIDCPQGKEVTIAGKNAFPKNEVRGCARKYGIVFPGIAGAPSKKLWPDKARASSAKSVVSNSVMPAGILVAGHKYRCAMTSFTGTAESNQSPYRYFQTEAVVVIAGPPTFTAPGDTTAPGAVITTLTPVFRDLRSYPGHPVSPFKRSCHLLYPVAIFTA